MSDESMFRTSPRCYIHEKSEQQNEVNECAMIVDVQTEAIPELLRNSIAYPLNSQCASSLRSPLQKSSKTNNTSTGSE